jgi:undecaprenyl-diphosphatase
MDPIQAFLLGIVQGLTEFLPISSSAHLIIVPWLLGMPDPGIQFDVALHMGTLLAVLVYFRRDWVNLLSALVGSITQRSIAGDPNRRLVWYILLASVPAALVGALGESKINQFFHTEENLRPGLLVIATVMVVMAALLLLAERVGKRLLDITDITLSTAMGIGLAQALSLIPGVSRSGSTITAGLFFGLKRDAAARFSFLLATPVILGAGAKSLYDLWKSPEGLGAGQQLALLVGFVTSAVVGFLCIHFLLRYLQNHTTLPFIIYRFALGLIIVGLVLAGFHIR